MIVSQLRALHMQEKELSAMNALTCRVASTSLVQAIHKTTTATFVKQFRLKLILYQFIGIKEATILNRV
jgi:hypothetical protein